MFRCKRCGYEGSYTDRHCPSCHAEIVLTPQEYEEAEAELAAAIEARSYEAIAEMHHILADAGRAVSQREFGILLENGEILDRDLEGAMYYFRLAAEQNDPYAAYRYSHLVGRTSAVGGRFWLLYAAVLGCRESFPEVAELYSEEGDEVTAHYYYAIAADGGDADAVVTVAKRYYNGVGVERNEAYAKWYMDKLALPPFHAIKMAYRLRGVTAAQPPAVAHPKYDGMLYKLADIAHTYRFDTAYLRLTELLAERGDLEAESLLGRLYAEGVGCAPDGERGVRALYAAASHGTASAYTHLGDLYYHAIGVGRDAERAVSCYKQAAEMGQTDNYETLGDIYRSDNYIDRNIAYAIELYEKAAAAGNPSAAKKAEELRTKRSEHYKNARAAEQSNPAVAFRLYMAAVSMGYVPAMRELARCYQEGIGTKQDRTCAYLWYKTAVEFGDRASYYPLGLCYARGMGVAFSYRAAIENLSRAEAEGEPRAHDEIIRLMERRRRGMVQSLYSAGIALLYQQKFEVAARYMAGAAQQNHPRAVYALGCFYEFGIGLPTDRDNAQDLYRHAAVLGFRDPRSAYKLKILRVMRHRK